MPNADTPGSSLPGSNVLRGTQAIILGIGDELLRGDFPDLNSSLLARTLLQHGWTVQEIRVVPDDLNTLADAMTAAGRRADLVITTGGLSGYTSNMVGRPNSIPR